MMLFFSFWPFYFIKAFLAILNADESAQNAFWLLMPDIVFQNGWNAIAEPHRRSSCLT